MNDDLQLPGIDPIQRQRLHLERPWELLPFLLRPCRVKILMVTDRGGSFGSAPFGLSALLSAMSVPPGPWARFDITTANRQSDPTAALQNFRFDRHDLSVYSQIWMFGVQRTGDQDLAESELRAIAQFMDAGGGVFATGDHEDLGAAMCRRVPRVRSMRKWHWPAPGPNGEPIAPNASGTDRHDTRRPGHDALVQFDDQSDDVPQRIVPRLYPSRPSWWPAFWWRAYPHPLLCGPRGVIRVLPDHMHEGACYETQDLSSSLTFDGYTTTEYPAGIAPQVIAWARVDARAQGDDSGPVNGRTFGVIGAYDGHRAGVGRVAVDATWHHFFNINLIGVLGHPDPIKAQGFTGTAAGKAALADITAYYRNLGVWLAGPATQQCMWWRSLWWTRWHDRIVMDLRPQYLKPDIPLPLGELVRIGAQARDALGAVATRCTVWRWVGWYLLRRRHPKLWERLEHHLDPWAPSDRAQEGELAVPAHAELLLDAVLGGVVYAVARTFPDHSEDAKKRAEEIDFAELVGADIDRSLAAVAAQAGDEARRMAEFGEELRRRG